MFFFEDNFSVRILSIHEFEWDKATKGTPGRTFHALSFRTIGNSFFNHDSETFYVKNGDIAFVPANYGYIHTREKEHLYVIHFDIDSEDNTDFFVFTPRDVNSYKNMFKNIFNIWTSKKIGYRCAATAVLYKIFEHMTYDMITENLTKRNSNMTAVIEYIQDHYCENNITIPYLSNLYGTSENHFRNEFKKLFDTTPLKYITNLRLNHARELLESGYYTVTEVANAVGIDDPKYFSRLMKNEMGISPSELL